MNRPRVTLSALFLLAWLATGPAMAGPGGPDTGPATGPILVAVREGTGMAVAAAPGGGTLVLDLQGQLMTLPVDGGGTMPLTDGRGDDRLPRHSPDGRWLAFQSFRHGHWDIWIMPAQGGKARPLTDDPADDREPAWTPDGGQVVFSSDRSGSLDLWSVTVATGELQRLTTDPGDEYWPAVARDGARLAWIGEQGGRTGLYVGVPGGETTLVAGTTTGRPQAPAFSPDGGTVAFVMASAQLGFPAVARQGLWQVDLATPGSPAMPVTDPAEDVFPLRPDWRPDGTLFYTADGQVWQRPGGTGPRQPAPFKAEFTVQRARYRQRAWSPPRQPAPALGLLGPTVSPRDGTVVYVALGDLWQQQPGRPPERLTNDPALERDPVFAPDGGRLVFVSDRDGAMQLWSRDLATGTDTRLTTQPRGLRFPVFAPDGRSLAFQQAGPRGTQDFSLHRLDLASGAVSRIRAPGLWPGPMAFAPDGKRLLANVLVAPSGRFREGRNQLQWISLDGPAPQPLGLGGTHAPDGGLALDPTGKRLALVLDGRLQLLELDDAGQPLPSTQGSAEPLTRGLAAMPAWASGPAPGTAAGTPDRLVFVDHRGLRTVSATGGRARSLGAGPSWQPAPPGQPLRIRAGRIYDGVGEGYREQVDILIRDGRIVAVTPWTDTVDGVALVDARDATVLPGLFDHHAHQQPHEGSGPGRAWLAFGVTSIVEPGGEPFESRELAESWSSGRRAGPRLFFAGPQLDGARRYFPFAVHADSARRLALELEQGRHLGASLAKTYTRLPVSRQAEAIARAHQLGIPVTSHEVYPALALGADRVEHLRGTSRLGWSAKQSDLLRVYGDVIGLLGSAGATVSPTVAVAGGFFDFFLDHPGIPELPAYQSAYPATDRQALEAFVKLVGRRRALLDEGLGNARRAVAELQRAGVRIVAGTDAPIFPPGLSLVAELANYRAAGLSGAEVLRSATSAAANAVGAGGLLGRIAPGYLADLVIVPGDPLADPAALLQVRATLKEGRVVAGGAIP